MWLYAAAEAPAQSGVSDQLIIMIGGVVTAAIVALGGVLVAIVNRGGSKTTPSPPAPVAGAADHELYERTAVLRQRADDADERFDVMDRRLDQVERVLDLDDPNWRRRP